jgi:hypothetical protein
VYRKKLAGAPKCRKGRVELVLGITGGNYYYFGIKQIIITNLRSTKRFWSAE